MKGLALGVECVFAGRLFNFVLAYAGQASIGLALKLLHDEVRRKTALPGLRHPAEAGSRLLMCARIPWPSRDPHLLSARP
ncbi:alpha-hydroxy-acid oxidizing protein [Achromobacter deleyi]|uniref:alpha-hydroxy-acid oxidizing protein n=1 Tax=Achromobacter deleyi TaxID=1353891 RepID=UPI003463A09D